jgi:hypothetical protein
MFDQSMTVVFGFLSVQFVIGFSEVFDLGQIQGDACVLGALASRVHNMLGTTALFR